MNTQKGFAHTFFIIGLTVVIITVLSVVFLKNFMDSKSSSTPEAIRYKDYTSITGSGLSFTYPSNWTLLPPDTVSGPEDGSRKFASSILFSQKPEDKNGRLQVPSDHISITLTELYGNHPFKYSAPDKPIYETTFKIGDDMVGLVALGDGSRSFNGRLVNIDPTGKHGASYIALNNDYYLLVTSQSNSYPSNKPINKNLNAEIEQAKQILKSVRLVAQ